MKRKLATLTLTITTMLAVGEPTLAQAKSNKVQLVNRIDGYVNATHHRQTVMNVPLTPSNASYKRTRSYKYLRWNYLYWKHTSDRTLRIFRTVPFASAWTCIHRYEGSWTDSGGPYYGGLQMDIGFQARYGGYLLKLKGSANNWTPLEQMWVAYRAYRSGRGFYPWPNTARACGLL